MIASCLQIYQLHQWVGLLALSAVHHYARLFNVAYAVILEAIP